MGEEHIAPDEVTFLVLLTACSHAGLVKEGEKLFDAMRVFHRLDPTLKHYTCMIDLFGRAGHFDKAKAVLEKVPHAALFLSMLNACRKWRNVNLGRWAFEQLVRLDRDCATAYVCMGNVYAAAGMQTEAIRITDSKNKAWNKTSECWWTDSNGKVHSFATIDQNHPQRVNIYAKLDEIDQKLLELGCTDGLNQLSGTALKDETDHGSCGNMGSLVIAHALINSPDSVPIHVTKNMRICDAYHSAMCLLSMIEKRTIHVNDPNRVHSFANGRCLCDDFR
jgi:pentatricopeptide repeat protein